MSPSDRGTQFLKLDHSKSTSTASADDGGEWAEGHGGARMRTGKCSQHPSKMGGVHTR